MAGCQDAPEARRPLIRVEGVSLTYKTVSGHYTKALDKTDLDVFKNEFLAIVGPSGCGKSTLLKAVTGLLRPTEGRITIGDSTVDGPQADVGMVFQNPALLPWKTVLGNVLYSADVLGFNRADATSAARRLLEMVGLTGFEARLPRELSGGMQQRASLCRALIHNPGLLVMDEPFGALDAMTREELGFELLRIWQSQIKTVIFVTHSISEAVILADRVVVMTDRPGRISKIFNIGLERPRDPTTELAPEFAAYVHDIRNEVAKAKAVRP